MTVSLSTSESAPGTAEADVLVIGVIQTPDGPSAAPGAAPTPTARITAAGNLPPLGILVSSSSSPVAPEDGGAFDAEKLRRAAGTAMRDLSGNKLAVKDKGEGKTVTLALPAKTRAEAEAVATGALLGGYSFRRYRATPAPDIAVTLLTSDENAAAVKRGEVIAAAVNLVRDLVNTAPSDLPPAALAAEAERIAADRGIAVQVLDETELRAGGYGGIAAVGQGSTRPPRLVRLEYTHPEADKTVAFVGKGITFDSGGLSLKTPKGMETMKCDMSGAAAAPPMSDFMVSMDFGGLSDRPPESNVMPLPTNATVFAASGWV